MSLVDSESIGAYLGVYYPGKVQMSAFKITFSELREKWLAAFRGSEMPNLSAANSRVLQAKLNDWRKYDAAEFSGATGAEMESNLVNGFIVPGLSEFDSNAIPVRKRQRPRFNDCEGDFRHDLFLSGDENHFIDWTKRETMPGVSVEISMGFRASTPAEVINEYNRWILQALVAFETAGVETSVSIYNRGTSRFVESSGATEYFIEVKREGERNDFTDWGAILGPGSYRILGFFTIILAAENNGCKCNSGFGSSATKEWGVEWNRHERKLQIKQPHTAMHFPEAEMTQQLNKAIAQIRG